MVFNSPSTSLKKVICHFWSDIAYGHGNYRRIMVRDIEMIEKGNWLWVFLGFASTFFCCCCLKALLPYSYLCLSANFLWLHSKAAVHPTVPDESRISQSQFLDQWHDLLARRAVSFPLCRDSQCVNWMQAGCIFIFKWSITISQW